MKTNWREGEILPREQSLPVPRLEIVWREIDGWRECEALYRLVYRHFLGDVVATPLGHTKVRRGNGLPPLEGSEVDTPIRDGAHIRHDAIQLRLPAFAVCGDVVTQLVAAPAPSRCCWPPLRITTGKPRARERRNG